MFEFVFDFFFPALMSSEVVGCGVCNRMQV